MPNTMDAQPNRDACRAFHLSFTNNAIARLGDVMRRDTTSHGFVSTWWTYKTGLYACRCLSIVLTTTILCCLPAFGQDRSLRSGADFQRKLDSETQITWQGTPLRDALDGLGRNQQVAIFLDRRVDPDQIVEFRSGEGTLEELFEKLAESLQLDFVVLDSVVYFGPPQAGDRLATQSAKLREDLRTADRELREKWLTRSTCSWERLAEPRNILSTTISESQLVLQGAEQLPHDLWPANQLSNQTLLDRVCLLLAGFDRTISIDPQSFQAAIVPLPQRVTVEKEHRLPRNTTLDIEKLESMLPGVEADLNGTRLVVVGSLKEHQAIQDLLDGKPLRRPSTTSTPNSENKRYTIRNTTTAAGNIVATVAEQLKVEVRYEGDMAEKLRERVTIDVEDVTLDELLRLALEPVGGTYRLERATLTILPR